MKNAGTTTEATVSENTETTAQEMEPTLEEAYIDRIVELEKSLAASEKLVAEMTEQTEKAKKKMPDFIQEKMDAAKEEEEEEEEEDEEMTYKALVKSLPEPVREMLKKAEDAAAKATEELRKERDSRRDEEFVKKAAGWSHLTVNAQEFGPRAPSPDRHRRHACRAGGEGSGGCQRASRKRRNLHRNRSR